MLEQLIVLVGGNVVLLSAVAWLTKSVITHYLSKDIENHKLALKSASEKSLIEHDAVFRSLHSKRADTIAHLHVLFVEVGKSLNRINNHFQDQSRTSSSRELSVIIDSGITQYLTNCERYFEANMLYLPLALSNRIESLILDCHAITTLALFDTNLDFEQTPLFIQAAKQQIDPSVIPGKIKELTAEYNNTIKDIQNHFRELIGIKG